MNTYIKYLHSITLPFAVPKQAAPVLAVLPRFQMCSRFLGTRKVGQRDGTFTEREMWTHAKFWISGYHGDYVRINDNLGMYVVSRLHVRIEGDSVETIAA